MDAMMEGIRPHGRFIVECRDPRGRLKWREIAENLVVDEGLNYILDVMFLSGTAQIDPFYVGLTGSTPSPASGDTMGSHGGWTEVTAYDETNRQEYVDSRTNQTVSNSGSVAAFTINSDGTTIGGAFLVSDNTVGGTSGTLLCASAFSGGDKSADSGDTVNVTYDFSASG
jgi:hypothetical protein